MLIIAHRGARSLAPENTITAVKCALRLGADMWETDVAITKDGELVLFHNDSLIEMTNVKEMFPDRDPWMINHFDLEEIKSLDAGSWFIQKDPFQQIAAGAITSSEEDSFRNLKIPTLHEGIEFTHKNNWKINIELKKPLHPLVGFSLVDQLISTVDNIGIPTSNFVISSFNHEWLREIQIKKPDYIIEALIGHPNNADSMDWGSLEFSTYNVNREKTSLEKIREVVNLGTKVNLYNLRNEIEDNISFAKAGVTGFITDFPQDLINSELVDFKNR
ncbi:MAG: hypothetical protein GY786_10635 [Proteobacteria bacterium]|nr:hypothetical protein [Pseudomonadota bacterium]